MQIKSDILLLIGEFTYRFLRFERYLIDTNHKKNGPVPYPDFKSYSESALESELDTNVLKNRFPELTKPMKKRRVLSSGTIYWKEQSHLAESNSAIDLLTKVDGMRDNLFHGSKVLTDSQRDIKLLNEAVDFLKLIESTDSEYAKYL